MAVLKILISMGKRAPTSVQNDLFSHINYYQISRTVSAAVRLMPKPPALVLNRNTKISFLQRKEIKPLYFVPELGITREAIFDPYEAIRAIFITSTVQNALCCSFAVKGKNT